MKKVSTIEIYIKEKKELSNPFNDLVLNDELGNYIFNNFIRSSKNKNVKINIYTKEEIDELYIKELIHNYFIFQKKDLTIYKERNLSISMIMVIVGIFSIILWQFITVNIIHELLSIIGWLFMWEAIYNISFTGMENNLKLKKLKILSKCNINIEKR